MVPVFRPLNPPLHFPSSFTPFCNSHGPPASSRQFTPGLQNGPTSLLCGRFPRRRYSVPPVRRRRAPRARRGGGAVRSAGVRCGVRAQAPHRRVGLPGGALQFRPLRPRESGATPGGAACDGLSLCHSHAHSQPFPPTYRMGLTPVSRAVLFPLYRVRRPPSVGGWVYFSPSV